MQVYSIEPNHKHRWGLMLIRLLHPLRFRFRLVAAGNTEAQMLLHIPGSRDLGQCAYGSLDPTEFEKEHIRKYLSGLGIDSRDKSNFHRINVPVIPLDDLHLSPDLIKLDVEGYELQALQGLSKTLLRLRPAILIEVNHTERWLPFLKSLGYAVFRYDPSTGTLNYLDKTGGILNLLCLCEESRSKISQILM